MTAQGEGNPVCCFLLSFPEFVFNLWRIPVHAAKFLGNREKSIMETKPDYSLPSANPSLSSGRGRCFGAVLVSGKWIYIFHLCSPHGEERKKKKNQNTNLQIFYLVLQDPSRSLPRDHKFFPDCHRCSRTLVRHIGRVSFVPPQRRGHATNNLRDHFSFYMMLNILYLKKKKKKSTPLGIK